jgi:hypothetical protein
MKILLIVVLSFLLQASGAQLTSIAFTGSINISNQNPAYTVDVNGQTKNMKGEGIQNFNVGIFTDVAFRKNFDIRAQTL